MKYRYLILIGSLVVLILALSSCFLLQKQTLIQPQFVSPANGATNVGTNVNLEWKASNVPNTTYKVFLGTSSNPPYLATVSTNSYSATNLNYSTKYYWEVVASANNQSATSSIWSFTTMNVPAPSTPVLRITNISTNSISLGWTQSKLASVITVYGATSNIFSQYAILSGSSTAYVVSHLTPSTVYKFFVVAANSSGRATSNTVSATTLSFFTIHLVAPSNGLTLNGTGVTLEWNSSCSQGVTYKVFFGTSSNLPYLTTTNATSLTENNLSYSTTYYWEISGIFNDQIATSVIWSFTTASAPLPTVTNWATMGPYSIPNSFKNISDDSGNLAAGKLPAFAVDLQNPRIMYAGGGIGPGNSGPSSEAGLYKSIDGGAHWFQIDNGLADPMVDSIWLDQSNPQILLVGTWLTGIFRSTDGGNNWTEVYNSQTTNFYQNGNYIYAATAQGVVLSQDYGQTWNLIEPTSNPVRVITGASGVLYAGLDNGTIIAQYGSSTWQTVYTPPQFATVWSIAIDPYSTPTVYVVEWQGYNYPDLIFTSDGGKDWNNSAMNYSPIQYVAFDVNTPGVIYAGADGSLYRSDDNGNTWNQITETGDTRYIYSWPGKTNTVVAGTDQGLYISYNSGTSWTGLNGNITSSLLTSFAINGSSIFTAVQDFSPIVSFNEGQNWNQLYGTNPPVGEDGMVLINPGNSNYVYAFTTSGFQYSEDGGNNFYQSQGLPENSVNFSGSNNLISVDPSNPSIVYVATRYGIYKSTDYGLSWNAESTWPSNPSMIFVSNGTIYLGTQNGLFLSQDGGNSWTQSNLGGASGYPVSIDVDPNNPKIVLVGMSTGSDQGGGILKSTDGGLDFVSSNSGITMAHNWVWDAVQGLAMWSVKFDPQDPAIVALATAGGIYISYDNGNTWASIRNNAVPNLFTDLAWVGNYLYVSSYGEGILRLEINIP